MIHEAVCFLAGWNAASIVCYFLARPLTRRSATRTGKVYFDPFETLPETPRRELVERCRR